MYIFEVGSSINYYKQLYRSHLIVFSIDNKFQIFKVLLYFLLFELLFKIVDSNHFCDMTNYVTNTRNT